MSTDPNINEAALAIRQQFEIENDIDIFSINDSEKHKAVKRMLVSKISDLIDHEFDRFVNILYRIDVNESKVKKIIAEEPLDKAVEMIADLIIRRQLEKIITRKKYAQPDGDLTGIFKECTKIAKNINML